MKEVGMLLDWYQFKSNKTACLSVVNNWSKREEEALLVAPVEEVALVLLVKRVGLSSMLLYRKQILDYDSKRALKKLWYNVPLPFCLLQEKRGEGCGNCAVKKSGAFQEGVGENIVEMRCMRNHMLEGVENLGIGGPEGLEEAKKVVKAIEEEVKKVVDYLSEREESSND